MNALLNARACAIANAGLAGSVHAKRREGKGREDTTREGTARPAWLRPVLGDGDQTSNRHLGDEPSRDTLDDCEEA